MRAQLPRHHEPWTTKDVGRLKRLAKGHTATRLIGLHLG